MMRSDVRRICTGLLFFGLVAVLAACGSMGGNDDDDDKFPEPPDRPSSAQVAAASPNAVSGAVARSRHGDPFPFHPAPPTFS